MMSMTKILLVDDHQIVRQGIRRMVERDPELKIVAEAGNSDEAFAAMRSSSPDLVLMDVKMPGMDGIKLTKEIKKQWPTTKVIILTMFSDFLREALDAGAVGYLSKDLRQEELLLAIRNATEGRSPIQITLEGEQMKDITHTPPEKETLTEREKDVLKLIAEGNLDKEIAVKLSMSETTVKRTLRSVFDNLSVKNRSEAVAEAIRRQLI